MDPTSDYELHYRLGMVRSLLGQPYEARAAVRAAVHRYARCPMVHVTLGKLLLEVGRTRAALRWFESALALAADPADEESWDAAYHVGLCSSRLAKAHPERAESLLPYASRVLRMAIPHAPQHVASAAEGLLSECTARRPCVDPDLS